MTTVTRHEGLADDAGNGLHGGKGDGRRADGARELAAMVASWQRAVSWKSHTDEDVDVAF